MYIFTDAERIVLFLFEISEGNQPSPRGSRLSLNNSELFNTCLKILLPSHNKLTGGQPHQHVSK